MDGGSKRGSGNGLQRKACYGSQGPSGQRGFQVRWTQASCDFALVRAQGCRGGLHGQRTRTPDPSRSISLEGSGFCVGERRPGTGVAFEREDGQGTPPAATHFVNMASL